MIRGSDVTLDKEHKARRGGQLKRVLKQAKNIGSILDGARSEERLAWW